VTALYEVVLTGTPIPDPDGAPDILQGAPVDAVVPEIDAADVARVAVRYQAIGEAVDAPAHEVSVGLPATALGDLAAADADLRWAASVAAFAEILKHSPFADRNALPIIEAVVAEQAERDADRAEFAQLFAKAKAMLVITP